MRNPILSPDAYLNHQIASHTLAGPCEYELFYAEWNSFSTGGQERHSECSINWTLRHFHGKTSSNL